MSIRSVNQSELDVASMLVTSEYGILREVALCSPTYFEWAAENAIVAQAKLHGLLVDLQAAAAQHRELVHALEQSGAKCLFLETDPHLPMQTFTRDSAIMTPWGLLISQMARPERRGEWVAVEKLAALHDYPVWQRVTAAPLEGGDVQILRDGEALIGVNNVRTFDAAANQLSDWLASEGWTARKIAVPAHFLHLDVLFSVVSDKVALCATEILDQADVDWLAERFELIPVSYRDVMRMGCNVTALGNDRILSTRQHPEINQRLRALGFEVLDPDIEQFVLEGGSTHCLTMPLRRY
ncbi:arginine deiminase [Agrobacterium tumefaciens]|uniref:dimethylarginine dimethylaminohydrolase family protein n=1 Tax=Agrobacterium tumefaciens TaxID=358 RepID=UPI0015719EBE|nr:arginine deiminase family protein [Agrobacterium tumefaciens]NTE68267.1 arginine deiminase [Agrobacterium tumefaciens]